jgi:hypothetical protein
MNVVGCCEDHCYTVGGNYDEILRGLFALVGGCYGENNTSHSVVSWLVSGHFVQVTRFKYSCCYLI